MEEPDIQRRDWEREVYKAIDKEDDEENKMEECDLAQMDVELALKLSKCAHELCSGVPHDIGIKLEEIVRMHPKRVINQ